MSIYINISKGIIATSKGEVKPGKAISLTSEEIEDYGLQVYIGKYLREKVAPAAPVAPVAPPVALVVRPVASVIPVVPVVPVVPIVKIQPVKALISKQKITATIAKLKDMPWQKRVQFINEADLELVKAILPRLSGEAQKAAEARVNG